MNSSLATDALKTGRRLELQYDGYVRVVEVHAVGSTRECAGVVHKVSPAVGSCSVWMKRQARELLMNHPMLHE